MERGQKLGVKYLFPWVLAPLRVGLASVSVVTGRELRGVLIADQLARASVVCRGAAHPVVEGRTTPGLPGGLRTGVRGWCWWCENWKSRWREGGSSSKPCRIGNHAGFVSTGQSPKTPTVSPSPCLLFSFWEAAQESWFGWSNIKIMVVGIETRRLRFHQPLGTVPHSRVPARLPVLSCLGQNRQSNAGRTAAHLGVVRVVVRATLAQREFPS